MARTIRTSGCKCGQVRFQAVDAPILAGVCYCDDCQAGGRHLESLPNAPSVLDEDGGASYLTYRDDRFHCVDGESLLEGHKLRENSPTQRYFATCCNSAIFLKYKRGHWVSVYRNSFIDNDLPPVEMRTNVRFRDSALEMPDNAPSYRRFPMGLFAKLIGARIAMIWA